jgi:hypothetical protein
VTLTFSAACPCCGRPSTWTASQVSHPAEGRRHVPDTSHITDITHEETQ